jgi:hypothetical protein
MSEFARTLRTADDADAIAKLLGRAAVRLNCYADRERLKELARRYTDYAAARAVLAWMRGEM